MTPTIKKATYLMVTIMIAMAIAGCNESCASSGNNVTANTESVAPFEGYNLFSPLDSTTAYLVDNGGNIVHSWATAYRPGNVVYLLENGELLHTGNVGSKTFDAGGAGGIVQTLDWDGNVTWEFRYADATHLQHHDVEMLPNGDVLMIAWQYKSQAEAIAAGRDVSLLKDGQLWPDSIIEVVPTGPKTGRIVWQWHVWDHLVQDDDATKANYGVVAEHPERIDLNYVTGKGGADWTHINAIDYNAELDQILLTVHNFSEIWVIDHSTTTAEAAGHSGGNSGMGGDLLYRWGNPRTYGAGSAGDQQLFGPHDAEWIEAGCPGAGDILIFNNGEQRPGGNYSSVDEIAPPVTADGGYAPMAGSAYGPAAPRWIYTAQPPTDFYARNISSAQRLPNGNTLICDGPAGYFFEVTPSGQTVWEYATTGAVFRVKRYGLDYPGLDGTPLEKSATPQPPEKDTDNGAAPSYPIVDTGQSLCYDATFQIPPPEPGEPFYGQDAQFSGNQPSYTVSADGLTVHDNVTGLTWMRDADLDGDGDIDAGDKLSYSAARQYADTLNAENFGGFSDWRVPTIKELYSLIDFRGTDPPPEGTRTEGLIPFIDTDIFGFAYGDTSAGERIIDSQWVTSTLYVSTVMDGQEAMFGVNFADGRIKGYPVGITRRGFEKTYYVRLCRGNRHYGINAFTDNADGTITDRATGLMWSRDDSGYGMDWQDALAWIQEKNAENYLGHNDWRLPNVKELQSIVDYTRSPDTTGSAAIDPMFNATRITNEAGQADYPYYWSGTTHVRATGGGEEASYLAFGRGMGTMDGFTAIDVHGAGCQRSDPKEGDPADYPSLGHGPQGDVQRVFNFVRPVRNAVAGD
jgi:Protein of unknown function (DUF1566)/Arylsulfotransferase (ASST)